LNRILIARGGAIGDFILTLPAIRALRDARRCAQIDILGYKHIAALAENRFYAQAVRSIEYAPLSRFFGKNSELPSKLVRYFASFDLVISYLYDPDEIFRTNLRRCGVENIRRGPARIDNSGHAARQLARPIERLGIPVEDFAPRLFPSSKDRVRAREFMSGLAQPVIVFHPGSGSEQKNWPLPKWIELGNGLLRRNDFQGSLVIVSGEADEDQTRSLGLIWKDRPVRFAQSLPLPTLAAVLEQTLFVGHDSGISHLAAAAGAPSILLFGPTDPAIWAPLNQNASVIAAPNADLRELDVAVVQSALDQELMRIGIST
jgi:heptosyltransferase-3